MSSRRELANAIRFLSIDAVQKANSGHPGMPMGMADIAEVLWNDFLKHNPKNPNWLNRDRFVLSNGHGSMLLYSLLHLTGYKDITLEELKNFRQLHSKTAGHPEYDLAEGIETTTGPLGQGIANAVGMALAERALAAQFNRPEHDIIDHFTYVFLGDGCLMEGISHEVCSFAGHMNLGKLVAFWDDNGISIDGKTAGWFTDDTPKRFEAYGWHVIADVDGHDPKAIMAAIEKAQAVTEKPTLICCKTIIGFGSPNVAGSEKSHGAALGTDEIALTRQALNWNHPAFEIPADLQAQWNAEEKGSTAEAAWDEKFAAYEKAFPELAIELKRRYSKTLPENFHQMAEDFVKTQQAAMETMATRKASQAALNAFGPLLPEFMGGSADLTGSNNTNWSGSKALTNTDFDGNYIYYGVREFGMSAIMNGLALHGSFIPYGGTFLVFADYARNAIRLSALMKQRVIYVLTHDSIGLGEDGPTHQPVEHAAMLRNTPNLQVWRPCDTVETAVAWQCAIESVNAPSVLLLSRQGLAAQTRNTDQVANIKRGGYVLKDCAGEPDVILIATGSEVELAMAAAEKATDKNVRVVSMPSTTVFDQQDQTYRDTVLPPSARKRIAIEAGSTAFWYKYVGLDGAVIGLDSFGESAPAKEVYEYFGITVDAILKKL